MSTPNGKIDYQALLKEGYIQLKAMREKLAALEQARSQPIAVVGIGCRFPRNADGQDLFWRNLRDGVDAVREVPADRWDAGAFYDPNADAPGKMYTRQAAFLDEVDRFDGSFFGISPRECESMDPQQRVLLEVAWEAIEDAAMPRERLASRPTGVYVGVMFHDYGHLIASSGLQAIDTYFGTGNGIAFLAGRLSYHLGLRGPSLVIDTACSSSLVAVHLACQSLRSGEIDVALAAGVNLILSPLSSVIMCRLRALAPDGRCKTFDASADGYGRGEGCGVVVLKRLSDAVADGDRVLAVIRGSAVNQDGAGAGITVPNAQAQQAVIRAALAQAGVAGREVGYVETHGTGTRLGDPLEARALWAVLGEGRGKHDPLTVGSLKTNVGHMEGAAGVGSLIKTILALRHREIPPHLHFHTLNPIIAEEGIPIRIPTEPTPWPELGGRRIGGVSSFGLSGTNAHVVLEEAPPAVPAAMAVPRPAHLLCLSARDDAALRELAKRYRDHIAVHPEKSPANICFTAYVGRTHFEHRAAMVVADTEDCLRKLDAFVGGGSPARTFVGSCDTSSTSGDAGPLRAKRDDVTEYERLARRYVEGADIDFATIEGGRGAWRIGLPTYPFQRSRYWLPAAPLASAVSLAADPTSDWLYETQWQVKDVPAASGTGAERFVVFADQGGVGDEIHRLATVQGKACRLVKTDASGEGIGPNHPEEYDALFNTAGRKVTSAPLHLVCLWGLDAGTDSAAGVGDVARDGCIRLLRVIQSLARRKIAGVIRLWIATRGAQSPENADSPARLAGVPLWGLGKVVSLEYPDWWGGLIDLPPVGSGEAAKCLWDAIHAGDGEDQVTFHSGHRHVARLVRRSRALPSETVSVRSDGIYWITGGLGSLGLELARWLVNQGARYLVLQSRSGLPDCARWSSLTPADGDVYRRVVAVQELERSGAAVEILAADVADPGFVESARKRLAAMGRPLRGIFHAAGVSGLKALDVMTAEDLAAVLRAKVDGTWNLHTLTETTPLDFFVCFSSIASVWGSRGLGHYAAANQFLDSFARYRRNLGLPCLSVDWGPLEGGGMGLDLEEARLKSFGIRLLPRAGWTAVLGRLVQAGDTQAIVVDVDWEVFRPIYEAQRGRPLVQQFASEAARAAAVAPASGDDVRRLLERAEGTEHPRIVEEYLRRQLAGILKTSEAELNPTSPLPAMGVDSLMAMELQKRITAHLGVEVPLAMLLQGQGIVPLAERIIQAVSDRTIDAAGSGAMQPGMSSGLVEGEI